MLCLLLHSAALVLLHYPDILSPLLFLCTKEQQSEDLFGLKAD